MKALIYFLTLLAPAAFAQDFDASTCASQGELVQARYPASDEEAQARCSGGTEECQTTWGHLARAKRTVRADYQALCTHVMAPPAGNCDQNCLDNAVARTNLALQDATTAHTDVAGLLKDVKKGRKANLALVAGMLSRTSRAEPKCWDGWRGSFRVVGLVWGERAWGAGSLDPVLRNAVTNNINAGNLVNKEYDGYGNVNKLTPVEPVRPVDPAKRASGTNDTANRDLQPTHSTNGEYAHSHAEPAGNGSDSASSGSSKTSGTSKASASPASSNGSSAEEQRTAEETGYESASSGEEVPTGLYAQMRSPVAENLKAAVEAHKAEKELGTREQQLAANQQALAQQVADLTSRRNDLASAAPTPQSSSLASSSSPSSPAASNAAPIAQALSPTLADAAVSGQTTPAPTLASAKSPSASNFSAPQSSSTLPGPMGNLVNANSETSTALPSSITRVGDTKAPSVKKREALNSASKLVAIPASHGSSSLGARLRQLLSQPYGPEEKLDGQGRPQAKSAAERALASVLSPESSGNNGYLADGRFAPPADFTGLNGKAYLPKDSGESSALLERDSEDLFARIRAAHRRFERTDLTKAGAQATAKN